MQQIARKHHPGAQSFTLCIKNHRILQDHSWKTVLVKPKCEGMGSAAVSTKTIMCHMDAAGLRVRMTD